MASEPDTNISPALALRRLLFGHRVTRILAVAAELRIADHLAGGPMSAGGLAHLVGANEQSLSRLLRALVSVGVLAYDQGGFGLTALGDSLRTDAPISMRGWALFENDEAYQGAWKELLHAVKTGETGFDHAVGMGFYQFVTEHPTRTNASARH